MGLAMDADWYLDHYAEPPKRFSRRRKTVIRLAEKRQRWRITLDELCYRAKINPATFDVLANSGALGSRAAAYPDKGRGRHITREMAQKTVLVARLIQTGLSLDLAGHVAAAHKVGDTSPLEAELPNGVRVTVFREDLP